MEKLPAHFPFILCSSALQYNALDWRIPSAGSFVAGLIRGKAKVEISFLASDPYVGAVFNGGINET